MTNQRDLRVFDHDPTAMESKAEALGFTKVETTVSGNAKDEEAAQLLLGDEVWKLALVHIHDGPWESLCRGASTGQAIVRLSTQGFGWVRPHGVHALCLCCRKATNEITAEDITALRDTLADKEGKTFEEIRDGHIDNRIRHLVGFTEPHILRTLHILMQGVLAVWTSDLAVWASDPKDPNREKAARLLDIRSAPAPPSSARAVAHRLTFQRALGLMEGNGDSGKIESAAEARLRRHVELEIGCAKGKLESVIADLLDDICRGEGKDVSAEAVLAAFERIDTFLTK